MIRHLLFLFIIITSYHSIGQTSWGELTGKQRAFFYQLTRKVENLKPEVFHLLEFTDSIPYVNDTLPDYPFVESEIEKDSSKLICHHSDFARKNRGLLMDIGTHFATWELDLMLQFRNSEKSKYAYLKAKVAQFERLVLENAPSASAKMWSDGDYTLSPEIAGYFSPNLTITEKIASLKNSSYNVDEKITLLNAIYAAQTTYIGQRASEIVELLTGQKMDTKNYLIAAGDGKDWNELESIIRTKYNRPLPDPKAFFEYSIVGNRIGDKDEKTIGIGQNTVLKMATEAELKTHLHADVWAYHPERQTTLIIQKGGNSYVLYGNNNNRLLSPDSTFGAGSTYSRLIDELENVWIADLKERIYGKRGFDYLIALYEKKIVKTRLNIKKTEEKLDRLRYTPEGPPKMKKKKKSRRQRKKGGSVSYQDNQGTPRGKLSKTAKKKQIQQHNLIGYEGQLQTELSTLRQLKKEKEEAFDLLARYEAKLDIMKKNYGYNLMTYDTDKNGYSIFSDGTTFNYAKQDLVFSPNGERDYFEVILVSFGKNVMDQNFEEVFLHLNLNSSNNAAEHTLLHESTKPHSISPYTLTDSIQISELFTAFGTKKLAVEIGASINLIQSERDTNFRSRVQNLVQIEDKIYINLIGSHNQFQPKSPAPTAVKTQIKYPEIERNKIETAVDILAYFEQWKSELALYAKVWIDDPKMQKKVLKNIKKMKLNEVLINASLIKV